MLTGSLHPVAFGIGFTHQPKTRRRTCLKPEKKVFVFKPCIHCCTIHIGDENQLMQNIEMWTVRLGTSQ